MKLYFELIHDLCSTKVDVYTVQIDDDELFEYEKFYGAEFKNHKQEIQFIEGILEQIKFRGARRYYFRHEGAADALPNNVPDEIVELNIEDQGVRLYCIRLSDSVLILLNGGIKTTQNPKDCPNVRTHFLFANKLANCLTEHIRQEGIDLLIDKHCFQGLEIEI